MHSNLWYFSLLNFSLYLNKSFLKSRVYLMANLLTTQPSGDFSSLHVNNRFDNILSRSSEKRS